MKSEIQKIFESMTDEQLMSVQDSWYSGEVRDIATEVWFSRHPIDESELHQQLCNQGEP